MRILFVRHGHPNYEIDRLTELGHLQAKAAADRLSEETISAIYASTCGRAYETAEYIAAPRGMEITAYDFMREITWGSIDDQPLELNGHPWAVADKLIEQGIDIRIEDWMHHDLFKRNILVSSVQNVIDGFDQWLKDLGYERDGLYYRVNKKRDDTIAMVSHGGSSSAVISHLFNQSFLYFCGTVHPDFTSISVINFDGEEGSLITPRMEILNDYRHIKGVSLPENK